ncbi:MAG TPA: serine/threonine protein kinase [Blastocatellia bacterium]|nr:serine/threonine protein kinase [Blastocatellia bacterium]
MPELKLENSIVDDRYLVDRCLSHGSYAEIFLASDQLHDDELVIIKALNVTLQGTPDADLEQTLVENFQNEAVALDKVRHPNIIRRLGHGTAADLKGAPFHYLVLEYMPGGELLDLCRRKPLSLDDALFYFQQVAEALAYAHSQRIIHRDIKPNNLLLSADKKIVKIADFGVAKITVDDSMMEVTRVGANVYAPPEHHPDESSDYSKQRLTASADIYSLAKTIYTAMSGRAPRQFARQPITELPESLAAQSWGAELLRALCKATQPRVADRYDSVQGFWEDFARLRLGQSSEVEQDDEATVVRTRLNATSTAERAAARPHFQTISSTPLEGGRPQKARIVVELPQHEREMTGKEQNNGSPSYLPPQVSSSSSSESARYGAGARVATKDDALANAEAGVFEQKSLKEKRAAELRSRREAESSFFDNLRRSLGSDWLRRVFIVFLVAALIGLAASTYYYFAEHNGRLMESFQGKEGSIGGDNVTNVNLRSEPGGSILAIMPAGTRVRVLEDRGKWLRIRVLNWAGTPPANAPDGGWVDGQFVK